MYILYLLPEQFPHFKKTDGERKMGGRASETLISYFIHISDWRLEVKFILNLPC